MPELKVHELRAETYNGMVRLLKPGCRTIVLIVDRESKEKLVPKFYKFAWPYRRNKTLMFGFLYIEKGKTYCCFVSRFLFYHFLLYDRFALV